MVVAARSPMILNSLPEGAFYAFPRAPWGTGTEFVAEAIRNNLLIIPGNVFSERDSHFRISYAVDDSTLRRGLGISSVAVGRGLRLTAQRLESRGRLLGTLKPISAVSLE